MSYDTVKNIDKLWNDFKDKNLLVINDGNRNRTFCKCGKVHTGSFSECPTCGNNHAIIKNVSKWHEEVLKKEYLLEVSGNNLYFNTQIFDTKKNETTEEYVYEKEDVIRTAVANPNDFQVLDTNSYQNENYRGYSSSRGIGLNKTDFLKGLPFIRFFLHYDLKEILKVCPFDVSDFDVYKANEKFIKESSHYYIVDNSPENHEVASFALFCSMRKLRTTVWKDKTRLNKDFVATLYIIKNEIVDKMNDMDELLEFFKLEHAEEILNKEWFLIKENQGEPANVLYRSSLSYFIDNLCREIDKNKGLLSTLDKRSPDLFKAIGYAISHYKFSFQEYGEFIRNFLERFPLTDMNEAELFTKFFKEFAVTFRIKILEEYFDRKAKLKDYKMACNFNNLKNIRALSKRASLEERGYDKVRLDLFMDSFYDDPLKAVSFIAKKGKISKEEMDQFLDQQTK